MSSTERLLLCAGALALLCGCQSQLRLTPDFGRSLRQDLAAQVADPEAPAHAGAPPPSNGPRSVLAQQRYQTNTVIQPQLSSTSKVGASAGGGPQGGN